MADGGLAGRTLLLMALEDPAGDLKNALLCHCLGFYHQLLCCLLCLTPQEKEKRNRHGKKWQDTLCSPSGQLVLRELLRRRVGPARAAQKENLLLLRNATAAGLLLEHMYVLFCIWIHLVSECAPTRRLPMPLSSV